MRGSALVKQRCDDPDFIRQLAGDTLQHLEPWSIDAIVIGKKNSFKTMLSVRHGHAPVNSAPGAGVNAVDGIINYI
jgi:hypothetical protein